ncbi:MAG TPA: fumarylacetoacetate hydrolase family protein [Steroidobacteraceae bacterium]|nr:fumarylacetoacetate hydrolase family protein [Steroidobacteraceae bacterium]
MAHPEAVSETRRVLLDGAIVEVRREGPQLIAPDGRRIDPAQVAHLPPVAPSKIICTHLNYRNRLEELQALCPPAPNYFMKPPSCLLGHGGVVIRPRGCRFLNYEGEVAIVIGRTARDIRLAEAHDYIGGYMLANDYALHDFRDADRGAMIRVKGADTLGLMGPGLVRGWQPASQMLRTYVNGRIVQESSLDGMIWNMAYLVTDLARMMTLVPGDVILSGTPANSRPVNPGDAVAVEVEGLGRLENTIAEGSAAIGQEAGWPPSASAKVTGVALGEKLRE